MLLLALADTLHQPVQEIHFAASYTSVTPARSVPFFSQFADISSPSWKKVGCGIASLAMIIDYYRPGAASVDTLLSQGIKLGAYSGAGWTYAGLINVSKRYGFTGSAYDYGRMSRPLALSNLTGALSSGPVIASVHYKFDPSNPIPHLVVVTAIRGNVVYYNDPAAKAGGTSIALETFLRAWKQRYIVIRPARASSIALS